MCSHACPVAEAEARQAVTPRAKMAMLEALRTSRRPFSAEAASVLYACNGCGLCTRFCDHGIDVAAALFDGRARAVAKGSGSTALSGLPRRFLARAARRRALYRKRLGGLLVREAELAILPGCGPADGIAPIERDRAVLGRFGFPDVPVADVPYACAGYALWAGGHRNELGRVAEETGRALAGVRTLVSGCPACVWTLRRVYPDLGVRVGTRVLHASELLDPRLGEVRLARQDVAAVYHDACYLGRHLGISEPPRRLAAACVQSLADLAASREPGACSGGGGLVPLTAPDTAGHIAGQRLAEARERGARLVVTACPTARRTLERRARGIRVIELMDLLAMCCGKPR